MFKKFTSVTLLLLITIALICGTAVFADEEEAADEGMYGVVTADLLNIRAEPGTEAEILGQIPYGSYVQIVEVLTGWASMVYNDIEGYVCTDYILIRTGEIPSRGASVGRGAEVLEFGRRFLGTPYRYGGSSPSGFDCSGFVYYCYKQFGVSLNRTAADMMSNGTWVAKAELQPGDIVGFYSSVGGSYIGHVGMYAGNGMMIHSPYTGTSIRYESIVEGTYNARYAGGRRILD